MSELQAYLGDRAIPELFNRLYGDAEKLSGDIERLQRFVELTMAERQVAAPETSIIVPVEIDPDWMESSARQQLEDDADEAARTMVFCFELMQQQRQPTGTSLACALRVMREASAGFECSQTMQAIIKALDEIGTAAKEAQNNG